jgi:TonB family protein
LRALPALLLVLALFCCGRAQLRVEHVPQPDYPLLARTQRWQGTALIRVYIGTDGRVIFAKGSGTWPVLVEAAEENARQWVFAVPPSGQFPMEHTIRYTYKLVGEAADPVPYPTVKTKLPDAVEIIATSARGFVLPLAPLPKHKGRPRAR